MIQVQTAITADNTDVLAGTDLANIPGDGQLDVYLASTQNDSLATITGPGNEPIVRNSRIMQRTNGQPLLNDDVPLSIAVVQGGHYFINLDVVTAATIGIVAVYRSMEELV